MSAREIAEAFSNALQAGDFQTAASYLADDFQVTGTMRPEPMGAQEWLGMSMALQAGIPDLNYNFRVLEADETTARVAVRFTGTHTQDLDLSRMGIGVIPATGVAFSAGEETSQGWVEDGKIVALHLNQGPDTGLADMLRQLGVELPGM
jgi:predicted ester cyclase